MLFRTSAGEWFSRNQFTFRRGTVCMQFGRWWAAWSLGNGEATLKGSNVYVREKTWKPTRRVHLTLLQYYVLQGPITENLGAV